MNIDNLYDLLLENNVELAISGEIELEDESIKWSYDGLGRVLSEMNEYLEEIYFSDKNVLEEFLRDNNLEESFFFCEPDFDETLVSFYIYEE
jgi:hypothetical protein